MTPTSPTGEAQRVAAAPPRRAGAEVAASGGSSDERSPAPSGRGFTLIEVLVAVTIASVLMTAAYGAFSVVTRTSRRLEEHSDQRQNLRSLFGSIEDDLRGALPPPPGAAAGPEAWEARRIAFRTLDRAGRPGLVEYALRAGQVRRTFTLEGRDAEVVDGVVAEPAAELAFSTEGGAWPRTVTIEVRFATEGEPTATFRRRVRVEAEAIAAAKGGR